MPIIDLQAPSLGTPLDTPKGFKVTPGEDDINHGSDAPDASSWYIDRTKPGWAATMGAAFRQDNTVVNAIRGMLNPVDNTPDGTNAWEEIKGTKYERHWESFVEDRSKAAVEARKRKLDSELEDRRLLEGLPWYQSLPAQMVAGVVDLPTLLPGGAVVRGAKGGFSIARSAMSVGVGAGIGAGVQEAALQGMQETRPLSESAINIGASVLLGGLLGVGGAKLLSGAEWKAATQAIERELGGNVISLADARPIYDDVLKQLTDAGVDEAQAKANAAVVAARYTTRAQRLGPDAGSPIDLYKAENISVVRGDEPRLVAAQEANTFDQGSFKSAGVTRKRDPEKQTDRFESDEEFLRSIGVDPAELGKPLPKQAPDEPVREGFFKSAGAVRKRSFDQRPTAPTFYSAVSEAVANAKIAKGSPDQWLGTLRNTPGVKPEEMEWLGLESWLKSQGKSVSKEDVANYIRANSIEIREVTKGAGFDAIDPAKLEVRDLGGTARKMKLLVYNGRELGPFADYSGTPRTHDEWVDVVREHIAKVDGSRGAPKFAQYTLPGGENYREMLLTLPNTKADRLDARRREIEKLGRAATPEQRQEWADIMNRLQPDDRDVEGVSRFRGFPEYRSSHWDEPNILAHVRFNDRVIDGKKTLFLEEVQSDWHQAGKKKGYRPQQEAELERLVKERDALNAEWERQNEIARDKTIPLEQAEAAMAERLRLTDVINDIQDKITAIGRSDPGVPDAPFKTTWPELILKRMIRYAAEKGYEKIAWTPGEVQAARYDLSKHVKEIEYIKHSDGTYTLGVTDKNGNGVNLPKDRMTLTDIEETVGKEIAEKIANGEGKRYRGHEGITLEGLDLKVGGEGMLGFYDDILPATANKLVKKYGARVRQSALSDGETKFIVRDRHGEEHGPFATRQEAQETIEEIGDPTARIVRHSDGIATIVHTLDLTPQLKAAAIERGFPLFQGDAQGRITLDENRAVIELFSKANESTFMHEAGHLWLDELVRDAAHAKAPQQLKDDLAATLKWLGVDDASKITREHHEKWARGFEQYLATGKAPSSVLAEAFEKFKQWLTAIYRSLTDLGEPIPDDIRNVMDRLLATDAEIGARAADDAMVARASSAGAAAVEPSDLQGNTIAGRNAGALAKVTAALNPALRALTSPSAAYRDIATKLFENSVYLKKNMDGFASDASVETLMKEWNGGLAKAVKATDAAYSDYRKAGGQMSKLEFREAVGRAMRRSDDSDVPEVAKVAQAWRSNVFDPLKEAAIKARLLPADVTVETAASYFSRMWNRNKLIAREGEFKGIVQQWVQREFPKWVEAYDRAVERKLNPLRLEIEYEEMAKLRRKEELKQIESGSTVPEGEFSEASIRHALRLIEAGAPKPKGVKTLTQFVADAGGLVDFSSELAYRGIHNKARPGFVRTKARPTGSTDKSAGGWYLDDMARHAWEAGYFPEHASRPSVDEFLDALTDDFFKVRAVVRPQDAEAYRLVDLIHQLENDMGRIGVTAGEKPRFATSDELKGMTRRVFEAMDKESDAKIKRAKDKLKEREIAAAQEREARFLGNPAELGRSIADEVFDTLTGKTIDGSVRPEFLTIKARGPLKERTFNIPDEMIEEFLESDVDLVGRRYTRVMGADVELAMKFGSPDLKEQIAKIRDEYRLLRSEATTEKARADLDAREKADIRDLEAMRDILRGTRQESPLERNYGKIARIANHINYIRLMGEVVLASLMDAIRPAMVHGLGQFMADLPKLASAGGKAAIEEAQLAGNIAERVLGHRLATITEIIDPYSSRGPIEKFFENTTNFASRWNGIRMWTDMMKSVASVMTQNRILNNIEGFGKINAREKAYMAYLGIDESMAGRIAEQFAKHGETLDRVRVAHTQDWTDQQAVRAFRAALNKDVDSIIVQKSIADVPLFAQTPTGRMLLQFKSFALASHQKVLLRGLQEDQTRFVGGLIAMTAMGMFVTWAKSMWGNRQEKLQDITSNPGWWIGEGLDRSGILSVPMELANAFEKMTGANPIKGPFKLGDEKQALSQKNQNRNELGSLLGPSFGTVQDAITVAAVPKRLFEGEEITQGQKNAGERLVPFNSYMGVRQFFRYLANSPN